MNKYILKILIVMCLWLPLSAWAGGVNTLRLGANTSYPPNVNTVGQGVMYLLAATDYRLAVGYPASRTAADILMRPIPPEAIHGSVMPIYQAILLLIGNDSRLVVDTQHKLVTVEKITDER